MLIKGFYQIVSSVGKENELVSVVALNKDHEIYQAHFPGNPITPGVCIVEILKAIVCEKFNKELMFNQVSNIKFLKVINPLETPEIGYYIKYSHTDQGLKVNAVVKKDESIFTKISGYFNEV